MATRLYLHNAANALSGTFPSGKQSALTQNYAATGATTLRTMDTTIGTAMVSLAGTSLNNTSPQSGFYGFFCSPPISGSQNIGGGGQTLTINIANRESSSSMNLGVTLSAMVYVWRPSTGAIVGTICANLALTGQLEPSTALSTRCNQGTTTSTTLVAAQTGDVVICEIWQTHTQATSSAFTGTFYYDGITVTTTTNTTVTNHASFINLSSDTVSFLSAATGTLSTTTDAATLAGAGFPYDPVAAAHNVWDDAVWDVSIWDNIPGNLSATTDPAVLSGVGVSAIRGTFTVTTAAATLSASATVPVRGALGVTTANATQSASATAAVTAALGVTAAAATLSGVGKSGVGAVLSSITAPATLGGTAGALAQASLSYTTGDAALNATGTSAGLAFGNLNVTTGNASLSASAQLSVTGNYNVTTQAASLSGTGSATLTASLVQTTAPSVLSATTAGAPIAGVTPMNEALNAWLTNRGFTGSLDDKINQYLRSVVAGSAPSDDTNDLWIRYAIQEGFASAAGSIQEIQVEWCKLQGAAGGAVWNDVFKNLPA